MNDKPALSTVFKYIHRADNDIITPHFKHNNRFESAVGFKGCRFPVDNHFVYSAFVTGSTLDKQVILRYGQLIHIAYRA